MRRFLFTWIVTGPMIRTLLSMLLVVDGGHVWAQTIRYVKPTGTGDGTSWANASGDLQSQINLAGVHQVWVAGGLYSNSRSIVMKNGVSIYGAFGVMRIAFLPDQELTRWRVKFPPPP